MLPQLSYSACFRLSLNHHDTRACPHIEINRDKLKARLHLIGEVERKRDPGKGTDANVGDYRANSYATCYGYVPPLEGSPTVPGEEA